MREFLLARKRIICIAAPIAFGLLFMVLCMLQLKQSIWFDESYSAYLTRFDYPQIWNLTAQDVHPPLFYFVLKTWAHFFGHTDFAMRMLSVLMGAVAILFAYLWLKYKYGATAAISAAALLAISPVFVRYGQEMRMYTMVLAIVFAATYVLQLAIDNGKKRWWVIYAVLLALGMWTHYFCALAWIAHLVYLIYVYRKKIFQKTIILTYVGAVALFAPWMPSMLNQAGIVQSAGFWIPDVSVSTLSGFWTESLVYKTPDEVKNWLLILVLFATVIIASLMIKYRAKFRMLLLLLLVPVALLILMSMPPLSPMFITRYILYSVASIAIISGVGLVLYARSPLPKRNREKKLRRRVAAVILSAIVLVGTSVCGLVSVYATGNYNFNTHIKSPSKDLYNTIVTLDNDENLAIISASEWLYFDLAFYTTKEHSVYFMDETTDYRYGSLMPLKASEVGRIGDLDRFLANRKAFWYITTIDENTKKPATEFPRKDWTIRDYSSVKLNDQSDVYAIVKMVKE